MMWVQIPAKTLSGREKYFPLHLWGKNRNKRTIWGILFSKMDCIIEMIWVQFFCIRPIHLWGIKNIFLVTKQIFLVWKNSEDHETSYHYGFFTNLLVSKNESCDRVFRNIVFETYRPRFRNIIFYNWSNLCPFSFSTAYTNFVSMKWTPWWIS